ncbi:dTMP kinase [Bradymonas sediminis]|uniref:Thymidylate kinase n=1 Tax=Bradymonas sediminis TaxID=1548548 RepID=A0A2Z4FLW8_9DELT|nr:dTMP kinase [Bradymonas sediminis]AWV89805.1 dTMP kinase [Bradymonas sediminis]TDP76448.1 thymidylate kinase [Bradymonas sediminis]
MPTNRTTPPFIVIEGIDGAGTTTQSTLLHDYFQAQGQPALLTNEPSTGAIGTLIRKMIAMRRDEDARPVDRETLALLFAADRLDHLKAEVEPALAAGQVVISDRYYHSSFAYQGDSVAGSDALDLRWIRTLNERARTPDLTVFLHAPVDLCLERLGERDAHDVFETREHLTLMEQRYDQIMALLQAEGEHIIRLDASLPRQTLAEMIREKVAR